jgi:hypothetical protein
VFRKSETGEFTACLEALRHGRKTKPEV